MSNVKGKEGMINKIEKIILFYLIIFHYLKQNSKLALGQKRILQAMINCKRCQSFNSFTMTFNMLMVTKLMITKTIKWLVDH